MPETLLRTKLFVPPVRPNLVPRPHLIEQLNQGLQLGHKLSLISAPAGFGKTTLISSWLQQLKVPAAWLSLDKGDNEPNGFARYLCVALQEVQPDLGESARSLLQSPQPPAIETLLTLLINDLADMDGRIVLVFDDYHVIGEMDIHKAIAFLLDNQPPQLHLVIISRSDPVFPLHRLRGSGQMTGIYVRDLRFTSAEVTKFLNVSMGLGLTAEEVSTLASRTEGWVAGLQLAALSMQEMQDPGEFVTVFAGDDRYVSDYLIGEVFERQPEQVQEFLLKTAILDRFSASLCNFIIDREAGDPDQVQPNRAIIDRLDQSDLFVISLDNKREWYRYHQLFSDFLRLRLKDLPPGQIANLHRRAAVWFAQQGFNEEAIQHYLEVKDFAQAANLIEHVGIRLIVQGRLRKMLAWLAELPDDFIGTRPLLCLCQAWILNISGQTAASEPLLQEAEQALATIESEQARHIKGLIEMLHAYRARRKGNLPRSVQLLRQASRNLSPENLLVRSTVNLNLGFNYLVMGQLSRAESALHVARTEGEEAGAVYIVLIAMALQANSHVAKGKLCQAITLYEEAIAHGLAHNHNRPFPPAGYAYAGLGQVMYEQNEIDKAEQLLTQAVQLGEVIADWSMVRRGLLPLAWLKQMSGDSHAARKLWQQALDVVQQAESERVEAQLQMHWARLQLIQAKLESSALTAVIEWAESYQEHQPDVSSYHEASAQMVLAQIELAQGQVDQAIWRLDLLAETAAAGEQINNLIKILTLMALAYEAKGNGKMALEKLDQALVLAAPEGYVRTFIDHGLPIRRLLQEAASHSSVSDYLARVLSASSAAPQPELGFRQPAVPLDRESLVEPLTERELRILQMLAARLSNREIAAELFLSINTIKTYTSRIYGKLGVHSRSEAVIQAVDLGLL